MKILVFSDSHGKGKPMEQAILDHRSDMDAMIFLGDGIREAEAIFEKYPEYLHAAVLGNNDFGCSGVDSCVLELAGKRIFCTHGHRYGVKSGLDRLRYAAEEREADLVLFGHTHDPLDLAMGGMHLFNPGSVSRGYPCTYGVVQIVNGQILCGHGRAK